MIREMRKEDLPDVKLLMQSIPYFWHECWTDETLEKAFSVSGALIFIYELRKQIVGCIFAYDFGFRAYIAELAVSEQVRNCGIAKSLLEHVNSILKERKCELIIADVWETAESFYKKLGWENPKAVLIRKRLIE